MPKNVVLLSVPGLREKDVQGMKKLRSLLAGGEIAELVPGFPCVTCPVQAAMTTGCLPREHGVVANGFYHRDRRQVEMWTAANDCFQRPQIWDVLHHRRGELTSRPSGAVAATAPSRSRSQRASVTAWPW